MELQLDTGFRVQGLGFRVYIGFRAIHALGMRQAQAQNCKFHRIP